MNENKFIRSVYLDEDACKGCINCIKFCPTQAIRVHNGKAHITDKFCIDCGRCIRYCPHHAKIPLYDSVETLHDYKYTVALPAPSLYAQFNNLTNLDIVLHALLDMGFDDVYEVSAAAELVSEISRQYIAEHLDKAPFISTACPTIVRLIRVKYPNLLTRLLPIKAPVEVAAEIARARAIRKSGLPSEDIGIFFISPCPSKVTYAKAPLGITKSNIDKVLAIKEVYPLLLSHMKQEEKDSRPLSRFGQLGLGWGTSGGEVAGLNTDNYLAADGIVSTMRVLEDLEDEKYLDLEFIELNACNGGCVGGTLTVENPYIAKSKLKKMNRCLPLTRNWLRDNQDLHLMFDSSIKYEPVFRLGKTLSESLNMMHQVEELTKQFPGLDCGACGAPTCQALAEDIVRGEASTNNCIYMLSQYIRTFSHEIHDLSSTLNEKGAPEDLTTTLLKDYLDKLTNQLSYLDEMKEQEDKPDNNS